MKEARGNLERRYRNMDEGTQNKIQDKFQNDPTTTQNPEEDADALRQNLRNTQRYVRQAEQDPATRFKSETPEDSPSSETTGTDIQTAGSNPAAEGAEGAEAVSGRSGSRSGRSGSRSRRSRSRSSSSNRSGSIRHSGGGRGWAQSYCRYPRPWRVNRSSIWNRTASFNPSTSKIYSIKSKYSTWYLNFFKIFFI